MDPGSSGSVPGTSSSTVQFAQPAGVIRRRRFSAAKIQPTRIKKVMQSDDDIGRMVQSVPVAIGRAMEHFAEKFLQSAALASQCGSSKTLTPQHMKQAVFMNPHFRFLEPLFKEVQVPSNLSDLVKVKQECNLAEQQQLLEQQKHAMAQAMIQQSSPVTPSPLTMNWDPMTASLGQLPFALPTLAPLVGTVAGIAPNGSPAEVERKPANKRSSTDQESEQTEKPKRGRPKKKKLEKCIDEDLFVEATENVEKEEHDREIMPPPALPVGGISVRRST